MLGVQKVMAGVPCLAIGLVAPYFTNEKWGNTSGPLTLWPWEWQNTTSKGAFHVSELTGQTIPVTMIISLLIKTLQPDQSNPK